MKTRIFFLILIIGIFSANFLQADIMKILVEKEIDDDNIIIVTAKGDQLLLEKWTMRLSPLLFEGKIFNADVSPMWVTIYIEGNGEIKWSIEKHLGTVNLKEPSKEKKASKEKKLVQESFPIELAHNDELFIINGERYEAKTYCLGWEQGDRVIFLEGSALGVCVSAKILNLNRNEVCEVWCE